MKSSKKVLITLIALIILGVSLYLLYKPTKAIESGVITIIVVDETGTEIINDEKSFDKGETMMDILERNYDIEVDNGFLIRIEGVEARDRRVDFIKIWINDQPSQKGIMQMSFDDGDIIKFKYTKVGEE